MQILFEMGISKEPLTCDIMHSQLPTSNMQIPISMPTPLPSVIAITRLDDSALLVAVAAVVGRG